MNDKRPKRVRNCTTHHNACTCREYQFETMEIALKVIAIWADVPDHGCQNGSYKMIKGKALDALYCLRVDNEQN